MLENLLETTFKPAYLVDRRILADGTIGLTRPELALKDIFCGALVTVRKTAQEAGEAERWNPNGIIDC